MIALINTVCIGSTGKIITGLQNYLQANGYEAVIYYGRGKRTKNKKRQKFCYDIEVLWHYLLQRITGQVCIGSRLATRRLIKQLRSNNVKEVFLENLHGYYINEKIFFDYLVKDEVKVVYIMADESAFWGNCNYNNGCGLYKQECVGCPRLNKRQRILFGESSHKAFSIKKKAYDKLDAIFVAPEFVVNCARQAPLLAGKHLEIVDEAIDVSVNIPRDTSVLRKQLGIKEDQIVIGCVAPYSYSRKGVRYLVEAAKKLENDERFVFVQVGFDIKDKSFLPKNYIPIGYVKSQQMLTEYYSLADLFVFPSLADTMPNACLEALSCGSPLLCFNTSGMPYMADDTVMTLVEPENVDQMIEVILKTKKKDETIINTCRNYALNRFDNQKYFEKLVSIMKSMRNN